MNDRYHTAFTEGENAKQFICFHPTVSTNDVIDSLNVAGSHCSRRPATPRFVSQPCLSFSFFTVTNPSSTSADIHTHFSAFHVCEWAFHLLQSRIQSQDAVYNGLEYMPLLKGGPKRWKWTEIILKSDQLIVNVVVFKLCNFIWIFLKSKGENKQEALLIDWPSYIYMFLFVEFEYFLQIVSIFWLHY